MNPLLWSQRESSFLVPSLGIAVSGPLLRCGLWLVLLSSALGGCRIKEDDDVLSNYEPEYLGQEGEEYDGNYFPLNPGSVLEYTVTDVGTQTLVDGAETETTAIEESYDVSWTVQPEETLTLAGGTFNVLPVTTRSDQGSSGVSYYEVTDEGVLHHASESAGVLSEWSNPLFLKRPLVVGEHWKTEPRINFVGLEEGLTAGFRGDVQFHVIGPDAREIDGERIETIRLDEVGKLDGTVNMGADSVTYNATYLNQLYLAEERGIVEQVGESNVEMTVRVEGTQYTVSTDVESELRLLSAAAPNGTRQRLVQHALMVMDAFRR